MLARLFADVVGWPVRKDVFTLSQNPAQTQHQTSWQCSRGVQVSEPYSMSPVRRDADRILGTPASFITSAKRRPRAGQEARSVYDG